MFFHAQRFAFHGLESAVNLIGRIFFTGCFKDFFHGKDQVLKNRNIRQFADAYAKWLLMLCRSGQNMHVRFGDAVLRYRCVCAQKNECGASAVIRTKDAGTGTGASAVKK